jgi:hypothetical protein
MNKHAFLAAFAALAFSSTAAADVAAALRAGTLGVGLDLNFGLSERLNARVGYSGFSYDDEVEDSDVLYDGEIKLSNAQALLDWHVFGGGFRLSFGAVGLGTKADVVGEPLGGTYEIGDDVFTAAQVGSLRGNVEYSNSVAPYVGFGWGNTVDKADRITFLFDIGAIYGGSPEVTLSAECGPAAPVGGATCNRLQTAVAQEESELEEEGAVAEWWPVVTLGIAVRF